MKKIIIVLLSILYCFSVKGQFPRDENPNYVQTTLYDDFQTLNRNFWSANQGKDTGIGILIDSTATINVYNGNLELKMLNIPGYTKIIEGVPHTQDYVGGEIISPENYCYGIYECRV